MNKNKITSILFAALLASSLSGCNNVNTPMEGNNSSSSADKSNSESNSSSGQSKGETPTGDNSTSPESKPETPDGEPTFLTAPDGTPIYTSQITEIYKGSEEGGTKETITLEEAERMAREGDVDFTVKCDGFAYGYIPKKAVNAYDDPTLFKEYESGSGSYEYLGDDYDNETGYGKYSTEYIIIKPGDKIGGLTVKSAYTLFRGNELWNGNTMIEPRELFGRPGAYLFGCSVEFEGEVTLTGYADITSINSFYGTGGDTLFFPDKDSSPLLPCFSYGTHPDTDKICHFPSLGGFGFFFGDWWLNLGNIFEMDCDTSSLHAGDEHVKVKTVLSDLKFESWTFGQWTMNVKSLEAV